MQGKTKFVLVLIMGILLIFKSSFATAQVQSLRDKLKPLVRQGCVLVADEQKVLFRYPGGCNPFLIPASLCYLSCWDSVRWCLILQQRHWRVGHGKSHVYVLQYVHPSPSFLSVALLWMHLASFVSHRIPPLQSVPPL